ncbi:protein senC [Salipiger pallidus]|uniref:Protein senC n=1 Tax=Salipiger pallidus TaxID=1775170 RepID=A0A8J3EHJ4_9RHOB|nr:SCO family protein [Salipiger pallidus]GGG79246.1 protein senC [Salipiger pallidus]
MRWIAVAASSLALVAAVGGVWVYTSMAGGSGDRFEPCRTAAVAGGAGSIGGPFELLNSEGDTVTDADVITEPSLVYFGYTFCPDVCPLDMVRNAQAVDALAERGYSAQPVFISIDPERDTPEVVGDFAWNIHEKGVGLTGSPEQVKAASQAYRTFYRKQEGDDEFYLVDHSTFTYLVLPGEGFVEYFRRDLPPEEIADRAACFIDAM